MKNDIVYPYLAYSEITDCVYIILDKHNNKIDVTSQYEYIRRNRDGERGDDNYDHIVDKVVTTK